MATSNIYKCGYKRLLRSVQYAFQNDVRAQTMARKQLRESFIENKNVRDPATLTQLAKDIDDIDEMLRFHIVQAVKSKDAGKFEVKFREEHKVAIDAEQDRPHGPELEPIDRGYIGRDVVVSKSKATPEKQSAAANHPELQQLKQQHLEEQAQQQSQRTSSCQGHDHHHDHDHKLN